MVVEDVSDKVEGMGDVSQEDSLQNADGTFYCIHIWSIICMHLIHRVGIKLYTYMHAYIHMCVHTYMYHMHDFIFIYKYILYHIIYINHVYHICDPTDPGDLINNSRRLNTIRKIM